MLRLSYEESCRYLASQGLNYDGIPPMPASVPSPDDEILGIQFFRTKVADTALENLTLPRTFFGRSLIENIFFGGSDLSQSWMCWNDFIRVSFKDTILAGSDLRASIYKKCDFTGCDLSCTDFRHANLERCDFTGANIRDSVIPMRYVFLFSEEQRSTATWAEENGPEPAGG